MPELVCLVAILMMSRPTKVELDIALKSLVAGWERFALHLLPKNDYSRIIQTIKANNRGDVVAQKLASWLTASSTASWKDVVSALQTVDENVIAKEIKSKYIARKLNNTDEGSIRLYMSTMEVVMDLFV